jgi:hypothetical protein
MKIRLMFARPNLTNYSKQDTSEWQQMHSHYLDFKSVSSVTQNSLVSKLLARLRSRPDRDAKARTPVLGDGLEGGPGDSCADHAGRLRACCPASMGFCHCCLCNGRDSQPASVLAVPDSDLNASAMKSQIAERRGASVCQAPQLAIEQVENLEEPGRIAPALADLDASRMDQGLRFRPMNTSAAGLNDLDAAMVTSAGGDETAEQVKNKVGCVLR